MVMGLVVPLQVVGPLRPCGTPAPPPPLWMHLVNGTGERPIGAANRIPRPCASPPPPFWRSHWTIKWPVEHAVNCEGDEGRVKAGAAGAKWGART